MVRYMAPPRVRAAHVLKLDAVRHRTVTRRSGRANVTIAGPPGPNPAQVHPRRPIEVVVEGAGAPAAGAAPIARQPAPISVVPACVFGDRLPSAERAVVGETRGQCGTRK